jgi:hypothetical protein
MKIGKIVRRSAMMPKPATRSNLPTCDSLRFHASRSRSICASSNPSCVAPHRDRPQSDVAHQSDLGHIPAVGERFCDDREFPPAQIGRLGCLVHPQGRTQNNLGPSVTTSCHDALQQIGSKLGAVAACLPQRCRNPRIILEPGLCDEFEISKFVASAQYRRQRGRLEHRLGYLGHQPGKRFTERHVCGLPVGTADRLDNLEQAEWRCLPFLDTNCQLVRHDTVEIGTGYGKLGARPLKAAKISRGELSQYRSKAAPNGGGRPLAIACAIRLTCSSVGTNFGWARFIGRPLESGNDSWDLHPGLVKISKTHCKIRAIGAHAVMEIGADPRPE